MSLPIQRAQLLDATAAKELLSTLNLSTRVPSNTFVQNRVNGLTKSILDAAIDGKTNYNIQIILPKNFEPVLAGLQAKFPDATITPNSSTRQINIDWA